MSGTSMARCRQCGAEFREGEMAEVQSLEELECEFCGHVGTIRYFPGREPAWYEQARKSEQEPAAPEGGLPEDLGGRPASTRRRGKTP